MTLEPILGSKTLFATHYHELTHLEDTMNNVVNYCIAVKENGDDIVFLRKIIRGGADKSYGIQVAKLAGVPDSVIQRAKELVLELSEHDLITQLRTNDSHKQQVSHKQEPVKHPVLTTLQEIDVNRLTPIEAFSILINLKESLENEQ